MTHDTWHMKNNTLYMTHDTWHMINDTLHLTPDTHGFCPMTNDVWHMTYVRDTFYTDTWHLTPDAHDIRHMAYDIWLMSHDTSHKYMTYDPWDITYWPMTLDTRHTLFLTHYRLLWHMKHETYLTGKLQLVPDTNSLWHKAHVIYGVNLTRKTSSNQAWQYPVSHIA